MAPEGGRTIKRLEGSTKVKYADGKYYITVENGDWFFGEF